MFTVTGTVTLLKRIKKVEKDNQALKSEMFNIEARLLKALSDNKTYLIQKAKELKATLKGIYICLLYCLHVRV